MYTNTNQGMLLGVNTHFPPFYTHKHKKTHTHIHPNTQTYTRTQLPTYTLTHTLSLANTHTLPHAHSNTARQPPQFDETLTLFFLDTLPVGILLHCLWGIWMFSSSGLWPRPVIFNLDEQFDKLEAEVFPCAAQLTTSACDARGPSCLWDDDSCFINTASDEYVAYNAFAPMPRLFNGVTFIYSLCGLLLLLRMLLHIVPVTRPVMDRVDAAVFAAGKRVLALPGAMLRKTNQVAPSPALESGVHVAVAQCGAHNDGEALYKDALKGEMFGNGAPDYDIRHIGKYRELLQYGDNMVAWRSVSPAHWQAS